MYIDPVKELKNIDEFVNEPDISDEERKIRAINRDKFVENNRNRIDCGI